jgi:hypothetical protein
MKANPVNPVNHGYYIFFLRPVQRGPGLARDEFNRAVKANNIPADAAFHINSTLLHMILFVCQPPSFRKSLV